MVFVMSECLCPDQQTLPTQPVPVQVEKGFKADNSKRAGKKSYQLDVSSQETSGNLGVAPAQEQPIYYEFSNLFICSICNPAFFQRAQSSVIAS